MLEGDTLGFYFGTVAAADDLSNGLVLDIDVVHMDTTGTGIAQGKVLGIYVPGGSYDYQGVGAGTYDVTENTFAGLWG
jgi:hypothetical protein